MRARHPPLSAHAFRVLGFRALPSRVDQYGGMNKQMAMLGLAIDFVEKPHPL
jgi:hypothetical protein